MPYVNVPNDLSKIKTKMAFNLTKRQLVCFGSAGAVGIPAYLLTRGTLGNTGAMFLMLGIMLPAFLLAMYSRPMPAMKWPTSGGSPGTRRSILWTAMTGLSIPLAYMSRPRRSSLNEWKPFFVCGTLSILCRRSKAAELMHISFLASRLRKLPRPRAYMRSLFASRSSVALNA